MLRWDLAGARQAWPDEAKLDPQEYAQRMESDFLYAIDHEGEVLDFHSLRHTCGAWLAMAGTPAGTVQRVLRHSSITLTMDAYGHLLPNSEVGAVATLGSLLIGDAQAVMHTGTDEAPIVLSMGSHSDSET